MIVRAAARVVGWGAVVEPFQRRKAPDVEPRSELLVCVCMPVRTGRHEGSGHAGGHVGGGQGGAVGIVIPRMFRSNEGCSSRISQVQARRESKREEIESEREAEISFLCSGLPAFLSRFLFLPLPSLLAPISWKVQRLPSRKRCCGAMREEGEGRGEKEMMRRRGERRKRRRKRGGAKKKQGGDADRRRLWRGERSAGSASASSLPSRTLAPAACSALTEGGREAGRQGGREAGR